MIRDAQWLIDFIEVSHGIKALYALSYFSDIDQLCLTIQHLYHSFPDDIVILCSKDSSLNTHQKEALASLSNEVKFLTSSTEDLQNKFRGINDEEILLERDEAGKVNVDNVKKNFAKRKRCITDEISHGADSQVKGANSRVAKLTTATDRSIMKLKH